MAASPSNPLVLYNVRQSVWPLTTSPHVFKTKLTLHYKQIPYRTIPLYIREIRSTLQPLGFKPTRYDQRGRGSWTLPSIIDPPSHPNLAPVHLSDSRIIASYLDGAYPSPKALFPPADTQWFDLHEAIIQHLEKIVHPSMLRLVIPCSKKLYSEQDGQSIERHFSAYLFGGKPFAELHADPVERVRLWTSVRDGMGGIASMCEKIERTTSYQVDEGCPGVYVFGRDPTYADISLIAEFSWIASISSERDPGLDTYWDEVRTWHDGRWARMVEAFERDYGSQSPKLTPISYGDRKSSLARL